MKVSRFTLIELLVSILILGFVMVAIWQITIGVLTSRKFIHEDFQPAKAGSITLNLLLQEIKYAHKFYLLDLPISEEEEKKFQANKRSSEKSADFLMLVTGEVEQKGDLSSSRLEFYSSSSLFDPRKGAIPQVSKILYRLEPYVQDGEELTDRYELIRAAVEASPRVSEHGVPQIVLSSADMTGFSVYKGVRLFRIQYYNGLEWVDVWTSSAEKDAPLAVRIDMVLNATKSNGESLPAIDYRGFDFELDLSEGDVRMKGVTNVISSTITVEK
mgnify:CR=1 FL=1